MSRKNAVLLNHVMDLAWAERRFGKDVQLVAHGQHICQILKHLSLPYFYEASQGDSLSYEEVKHLTLNWHRDKDGRDLSFGHGISPGQIISGSAWMVFASFFREHEAIKRWLEKVDAFYVSKDEHPRFIAVAKSFGDKVHLYDPGHALPCLKSTWVERVLREFPVVRQFSLAARLVQKPIMSLVRRRKHLYVADWTSDRVARKDPDGLCQNSLVPWRGYYFSRKTRAEMQANQVFPKALGDYASKAHLKEVLGRVGACWDDALLSLCGLYLRENYSKCRAMFVRTYAVFKDLLDYYQPSLFLVPGEIYEPYTIVVQLAKSLGITTRYLVDGFGVLALAPLYRDETGKNWMFDEFACFGEAMKRNYVLAGANPKQCVVVPAPLLEHHKDLPVQEKSYDAIVMTWIPMHLNPYSREEFGGQILADVTRLLLEEDKQKIAVKIKSEAHRSFYEAVLDAEGLSDKVDILSGFFYEHVLKAEMIVGGISSAVAESFYHGIPYYLYEPYQNGYSDAMIEQSSIISRDSVARTVDELRDNMHHRRIAVKVTRDYMFDGVE